MVTHTSRATLTAAASWLMPSPSTMCGIWCVSTAPTASRAEPCPSDNSQKAGVRRAWRTVNDGSAACSSSDPDVASPSGAYPWSSGRPRMIWARGSPRTTIAAPEICAVVRQPSVAMAWMSNGTRVPPRPMPANIRPRAVDRRRTNQLAMVEEMGMKPPRLAPKAMRAKDRYREMSESISASRKKPAPNSVKPTCMTRRGP